MHFSNILVMVDPKHADGNSLQDIVSALADIGAEIIDVDREHHVIEASIALREVPTVEVIGGVSYVRPVFTYFARVERSQNDGR
jgi:hypothetical protein